MDCALSPSGIIRVGGSFSSFQHTMPIPSSSLCYCFQRLNHLLIFPGGGIFFYWQAGVVTYLRDHGYDLSAVTSTGASAGALTATLAATDVDYYKATDLALDMVKQAGVWDRTGGLQGIWGPMIYDWLDELLLENAVELSLSPTRAFFLGHTGTCVGKRKG